MADVEEDQPARQLGVRRLKRFVTIAWALLALASLLPASAEVLPFVLKGKVEFALIRDLDGCVQWPWRVYA